MVGSKTGQGFIKSRERILTLDLDTLEYRPAKKSFVCYVRNDKSIDKPIDRFKVLVKGKDKAGEFYRKSFAGMFAYVSNEFLKYQMNTKLMML
jgi:3-hydroxyacyl-CoA dehydrogenase